MGMTPAVYRFFYDQLQNDWERVFYSAVEWSVRAIKRELMHPHVPGITNTSYMRIMEYVYDDHAEFFSFFPLRSEIQIQGAFVYVTLSYRYSLQLQKQYESTLEKVSKGILSECFGESKQKVSELAREKKIFDWITRNVVYDYTSIGYVERREVKGQTESVAWNAYGALVERKAVCEGIACAFKMLCERVGLPCIVVLGHTPNGRHAWNIVCVQGRFYHVDCTWDLRSELAIRVPYARYRYFNLPDPIIAANHTPECPFLPECKSLKYNPFFIRGLCARKAEDLWPIIQKQMMSGQKRFAVMAVQFQITEFIVEQIIRLCEECAGRRVQCYLDQSGFFIGFTVVV